MWEFGSRNTLSGLAKRLDLRTVAPLIHGGCVPRPPAASAEPYKHYTHTSDKGQFPNEPQHEIDSNDY